MSRLRATVTRIRPAAPTRTPTRMRSVSPDDQHEAAAARLSERAALLAP